MSAAVWALTGDLFLEDDLLMAEEATELARETEQLCRLPLKTAGLVTTLILIQF